MMNKLFGLALKCVAYGIAAGCSAAIMLLVLHGMFLQEWQP